MSEKSKIEKRINFARGAFGITIGLCALVTIALFGANMDAANFPGSNIQLDVYPDNVDKKGQYKAVVDGYLLENVTTCSNFIDHSVDTDLCMSTVEGKETGDQDKPTKQWESGWISATDCKRTSDTSQCAPFSAWGALSILGMVTFGLLAIQTLLFTAHTGVAMTEGAVSIGALKELYADTTKRFIMGLTIIWGILGFGLFVWAALSWQSMCDKIDTGLGRIVSTGSPLDVEVHPTAGACATTGCASSFVYFFVTYALSIVWSTIPYLLVWFGLLESA